MKLQSVLLSLALLLPVSIHADKTFEVTPATFAKDINKIKQAASTAKEDIIVNLHDGVYDISSPIVFDARSTNRNGHRLRFVGGQDGHVTFSGGTQVKGWQRVHGNLWKAPYDSNKKLRSLFIDGKRYRMAGGRQYADGLGQYGEIKITGKEPWAFGEGVAPEGIKLRCSSEVQAFRNPDDVELVQFNIWHEKILCAEDMQKWGDTIAVKLQQPSGAILTSLAWAAKVKYEGKFFVRNAFELLDDDGEFYFDRRQHVLYAMIPDGIDPNKVEVIAPRTEGLVKVVGTDCQEQAGNISFENITFAYDAWDLMHVEESHGFGGIQSIGLATKYIPDGNWHPTKYNSCDVPDGTIEVRNARNVTISGCRFEHLSSAIAVNMDNDVSHSAITGNAFTDLLGTTVSIGHPQHYEIGDGEGRFPKGIEGLCHDISITDNYVRNTCLDFRQLEGMIGFFVKNVRYDHNDIAGVPYGAIALGWWWGNAKIPESEVAGSNSISFNRIHGTQLVLSTDGGSVYMLGKQPGSVCEGNYITNGSRCIYPDDGSSGWLIKGNFVNALRQLWLHIDSDRDYDIRIEDNYVKDNYLKNSGKGVEVKNMHVYRNIPFDDAALSIDRNSGIRAEYKRIMPSTEPEAMSIYIELPQR